MDTGFLIMTVTDKERQDIKEAAEYMGLTLVDFIRRFVLTATRDVLEIKRQNECVYNKMADILEERR